MKGLNKLGIALAVVFPVLIIAIIAEICYVFYRRRKFGQRNRVEDDSEFSITDDHPISNHQPSKELLLYYFCWKTQTPIEPDVSPTTRVQPDAPPVADEAGNVLKSKQGLYVPPSRFLFTIKEDEEREGVDSPAEKTTRTRVMSLEDTEECFGRVVVVDDEATPFSTPCGSPFYFTPAASPTREVGLYNDGDLTTSPRNIEGTVSFVSLAVHCD